MGIHLSLEDNDEKNDHDNLVSDNNGNNDNDNKDHDHPNDPNTLQTDSHDNTPLKIYVKPSVSFDISTKQGDDSDKHHNEDNDDNDTSRKCMSNSLYPPIVNNPTQILFFPLINPK